MYVFIQKTLLGCFFLFLCTVFFWDCTPTIQHEKLSEPSVVTDTSTTSESISSREHSSSESHSTVDTQESTSLESTQLDAAQPELRAEAPPEKAVEKSVMDRPGHRILQVGPQEKLKRPSDAARIAQDGDTIEIAAGLYKGDVAIWRAHNLTIRGKGGKSHLQANGKSAEGKGIWVIKGNNTTIQDIEFSGSKVRDKNGAGIRQEGTNLTLRHCYFHDNENGLLAGNNEQSTILIEHSIFERNGHGDGQSHNIYINRVRHFILRYSFTHQTKIGHNVKTRAIRSDLLYNRISDEDIGTSSYSIDLSNGGEVYIIGNVIQQSPKTKNSTLVSYGAEGLKGSKNALYFIHNTVVNNRHTGYFLRVVQAPQKVQIINNLWTGKGHFTQQASWDIRTNLHASTYAGFLNPRQHDYRLKAHAQGHNQGSILKQVGSISLQTMSQYKHPAQRTSRTFRGKPALGAYEEP